MAVGAPAPYTATSSALTHTSHSVIPEVDMSSRHGDTSSEADTFEYCRVKLKLVFLIIRFNKNPHFYEFDDKIVYPTSLTLRVYDKIVYPTSLTLRVYDKTIDNNFSDTLGSFFSGAFGASLLSLYRNAFV